MTGVVQEVFNLEELAEWLANEMVPSIFDSVTYTEDEKAIRAYDEDGNLFMLLRDLTNTQEHGVRQGGYWFYKDGGSYYGVNALSEVIYHNYSAKVVGCPNGFIFRTTVYTNNSHTQIHHILVAKTNNGRLCAVFPGSNNSYGDPWGSLNYRFLSQEENPLRSYLTGFFNSGDSTAYTCNSTTQLVNFIGNPPEGESIIYTPYAFYMPSYSGRQYVNTQLSTKLHTFTLNGDLYITNGAWSIKAYSEN